MAFVLAFGTAGCGKVFPGKSKGKPEPLVLVAFASDTTVGLGDPLVIEAVLISQYKKNLVLPELNAESLVFWFTDEATGRTFRREPVVTPKEDLRSASTLERGGVWRRRFVLTQATDTSGTLRVQLFFGGNSMLGDSIPGGQAISVPFAVGVKGSRSLHRDNAGVLVRDDAIRIARTWAGMPDARAQARLVENEAGFLDWWVRLAPEGSSAYARACLVNPYLGEFRAEVNPAIEPPAPKEPEIKVLPPRAPAQPLGNIEGRKAP